MQQTEIDGPGFFLVLEGGNGSGKTTVLTGLVAYFNECGHEVVCTREPGGTQISEAIRSIILDPKYTAMHASTELLLFAAARAQHFYEKILPNLNEGRFVISDRFSASTMAFQGYARGYDKTKIEQANRLAINDFQPHLTLILDIDPELGMKRARARGALDRHELEKLDFHIKARQGYLAQAQENPERFALINADQPPEDVLKDALTAVLKHEHRFPKPTSRPFLSSQESY